MHKNREIKWTPAGWLRGRCGRDLRRLAQFNLVLAGTGALLFAVISITGAASPSTGRLSAPVLIMDAVLICLALSFYILYGVSLKHWSRLQKGIEWLASRPVVAGGAYVLACLLITLAWMVAFFPTGWLSRSAPAILERLQPLVFFSAWISAQYLFFIHHPSFGKLSVVRRSSRAPRRIVVCLAIAFGFYLIACYPGGVGMGIRQGGFPVWIPLLALLTFAFSDRSGFGKITAIIISLFFFVAPLAGLWNSGVTVPGAFGGLLPVDDPLAYYLDASMALDGRRFLDIANRPLFPGFLALVTWLTGHNLQACLILLATLAWSAVYLFSRLVEKISGAFAAALVFTLCYLFFRPALGVLLTENLGLLLGAAGSGLLISGVIKKSDRLFFGGLFVFSLATAARPGAVFILPLLVIWYAWDSGGRFRICWRKLAVGVGLVASVLVINQVVYSLLLAPGSSGAFSNYSYVFYGWANGTRYWPSVYDDHPFVRSLSMQEQPAVVFRLAWERFVADPLTLFAVTGKSLLEFFSPQTPGIFSFLGEEIRENWIQRSILVFFLAAGVVAAFCRRKNPLYGLFCLWMGGILVSIPFAPAILGIRAYTAAMPVLFLIIAAGVVELFKGGFTVPETDDLLPVTLVNGFFSALVVSAILIFIVFLKTRPVSAIQARLGCAPGSAHVIGDVQPGAYLRVLGDHQLEKTRLPLVRWSEFERSLMDVDVYMIQLDALRTIDLPALLIPVYNQLDEKPALLVLPDDSLKAPYTGKIEVCGSQKANPIFTRIVRVEKMAAFQ